MRNTVLWTGVVGGLLCLGAQRGTAEDWPQWRGPNRDAKAAGFKAPSAWPKELTQKWKAKVGNGVATPALVGDRLYVIAREGGDEVVRCLDANTGHEHWQEKYPQRPAGGAASGFPGPRSSPAVADGKLVTLGVSSTLSCFDAGSGKLAWRKDDFARSLPRFSTSCSPVIADGLCVVQLGGEREGAVVAYDLVDGNQKWKWPGDGTAYSSPVLASIDGKKMVVAVTAADVVGLDLASGTLLWKTSFQAGYNACTPLVAGNTVIYSGGARGSRPATHAVRIEKEGDHFAAKELWNNPEVGVQFNTPVLKDGLVFGLSSTDNFFGLSAETGKTAWTAPKNSKGTTPPPAAAGGGGGGRGRRGGMMGGTVGYGSIVDAGSVLLALTPSMELIVFEPNGEKYHELARYKVAGSPTFAYPVVVGNRLYVKDQDSVTLWTIE